MSSQPNYTVSQLNKNTSLVIHNDKYLEFPYVYVKSYPTLSLGVIIDTGCGGKYGKGLSSDPDTGIESPPDIKEFIEEHVLGMTHLYEYMVICTHCHFDHIGGIEPFAEDGCTIVASGYDKEFLREEFRDDNSLCSLFGTRTPEYAISTFAEDGERLTYNGHDLGLRILHTPGHTPDSLAIYDERERWLFTGDTAYKRVTNMPWGEEQKVPIVLPLQGNWKDFVATLAKLHDFAQEREKNQDDEERPQSPLNSMSPTTAANWQSLTPQTSQNATNERVRLAAGHTTSDALAVPFLESVMQFIHKVEKGKVREKSKVPGDQVAPGGSLGDAMFVLWEDEGEPEFSLMAPEKFKNDFSS